VEKAVKPYYRPSNPHTEIFFYPFCPKDVLGKNTDSLVVGRGFGA
jgi:hypothetical protein